MAAMMNTLSRSSNSSADLSGILGLRPEFLDYLKSSLDGKQLERKFIKETGGKVTLSLTYCNLESAENSPSTKVPAKYAGHTVDTKVKPVPSGVEKQASFPKRKKKTPSRSKRDRERFQKWLA